MFLFFAYLAVRRLLRVFAGSLSIAALEVENAVLGYQLAVLGRGVKRPGAAARGAGALAAASLLLPCDW